LPALVVATAVLVLAVGIVRRTGPVAPPATPARTAWRERPSRRRPPRREPQAVRAARRRRASRRRSSPAAPDKFMNLPILRNLEKLEHFEAIQTTTLDDDPSTPNG
jgi:hypothetical protein